MNMTTATFAGVGSEYRVNVTFATTTELGSTTVEVGSGPTRKVLAQFHDDGPDTQEKACGIAARLAMNELRAEIGEEELPAPAAKRSQVRTDEDGFPLQSSGIIR